MGEKEVDKKETPGAPPNDVWWLVPWGAISLCWLYFLSRYSLLPLQSVCKSDAENLIVSLKCVALVLLRFTPLLGAILVRWVLKRWRLYLVWHFLGILGLIISVLAVLIVWQDSNIMYESIECRALSVCRNISAGILLLHKATGEWPYYCSPFDDPDREPCIDFLYMAHNNSEMPDLYEPAWETWGTVSDDMFFHLAQNGRDRPLYLPVSTESTTSSLGQGWKGPYIPYVTDDPWGNNYLASVGAFEGGRLKGSYVWCISAGPNECLETPTTAAKPQGDDIGYRMESR